MQAIRLLCAAGLLAVISPSTAAAFDRPCGGPLTSLFIPQGFAGADYRPACRFHDACYAVPGASRLGCDLAYRDMMYAQCDCSRFPLLCRMRANNYFLAARLFGGPGYWASQRGLYPPGSYSPAYMPYSYPTYGYPAGCSSCSVPVAYSSTVIHSRPVIASAPRTAGPSSTRAAARKLVSSSRPVPTYVPPPTHMVRHTTQRVAPMPIDGYGW